MRSARVCWLEVDVRRTAPAIVDPARSPEQILLEGDEAVELAHSLHDVLGAVSRKRVIEKRSTAKEPMAEPYTTARLRLGSLRSPVRAR